MHYFTYKKNELCCDEISISEIAKKIPTPFYLYSSKTIFRHYHILEEAFKKIPHHICYSVKANSNLSILKLLASYGAYFDIVSKGELFRLQKIKVNGSKIVYAGVGKRKDEIEYALKKNIFIFTVESLNELDLINKVASSLNKVAKIALRINPEVEPYTHKHITTGKKENKFGINISQLNRVLNKIPYFTHIKLKGLHCHIGSQILDITPFISAFKKLLGLISKLKIEGLEWIDIGGGLGIVYHQEEAIGAKTFANAIIPFIKDTHLKLLIEPGRYIVGNAGVLVTKVIYVKYGEKKRFIIVDAGMNDLIRPALYGAYHQILPCKKTQSKETIFDIVGPICESGDFFAQNRKIPTPQEGDLLTIMSAGAYGITMSSNYNSRPRCSEVMVIDNNYYLIRKAETYQDLIKKEVII